MIRHKNQVKWVQQQQQQLELFCAVSILSGSLLMIGIMWLKPRLEPVQNVGVPAKLPVTWCINKFFFMVI